MEFFIKLNDGKFFRCAKLQEIVIGMIGMVNAKAWLDEEKRWIVMKPHSVIAVPLGRISEMEIIDVPEESRQDQQTKELTGPQ